MHILLFNRYVVINHTNICLDPNFFRKNILHVLISKKISAKFRPNFAKFGNFGGGRNFSDTEIKNLGLIIHVTVFFSHNKPAPVKLISPETDQRT